MVAAIDARANRQAAAGADPQPDQSISPAMAGAFRLDLFDFRPRQLLLALCGVDGERIGRHCLYRPAEGSTAGQSDAGLGSGCELAEVGPTSSLGLGRNVRDERRKQQRYHAELHHGLGHDASGFDAGPERPVLTNRKQKDSETAE